MRVVFMGSPEFSLPTLFALSENYAVVGVVSQPDRPAGRGRNITAPPTKAFAEAVGIPVIQPERVGKPDVVAQIADLGAELIVVAAYGQILPQELLDLPARGSLNVHASLLPRWRGAAPVQAAVRNGDPETGVTIMLMDAGLDTGPILSQRSTPIGAGETGGVLSERLAVLGAELLIETLPDYLSGQLKASAQDDALATHAPMLRKSDGVLDLRHPAADLVLQIQAYDPWPGTYIDWEGSRIGVKRAYEASQNGLATGQITLYEGFPAVSTGSGLLVLDRLHPEGRKEMSGKQFLRGTPEFLKAHLLG